MLETRAEPAINKGELVRTLLQRFFLHRFTVILSLGKNSTIMTFDQILPASRAFGHEVATENFRLTETVLQCIGATWRDSHVREDARGATAAPRA